MQDFEWYQDVLNNYEDDLEFKIEEAKLDITEEICKAMDEIGLSRKQLAEKMKTSPAAITKFLNGNSNFTLKTLVKFSMCLNKELVIGLKTKNKKQLDPYELFYTDITTKALKTAKSLIAAASVADNNPSYDNIYSWMNESIYFPNNPPIDECEKPFFKKRQAFTATGIDCDNRCAS